MVVCVVTVFLCAQYMTENNKRMYMKTNKLWNYPCILVIGLFATFAFSSCDSDYDEYGSSNYNIIGTWTGYYIMPTGTRVNGKFCFNSDYTGTYERSFKSNYSVAFFTWNAKGNIIQCNGYYSDYDGNISDFNHTITLENDGTSFEYGGIKYHRN